MGIKSLPLLQSDATPESWALVIRERWLDSVEAIFDVGRLLIRAKATLPLGEWQAMVEQRLPFHRSTAFRLMAIANDERLIAHVQHGTLPPHWGTIYELTKLDDDALAAAFEQGVVNADMPRSAISGAVKSARRAERERALAHKQRALPSKKYGVIVADPPWAFEPWSRRTGMDRAADNHYPTQSGAAITAQDVAAIAADDCLLFLWATVPMLEVALTVLNGWGFTYKSHLIWNKQKLGTGFWFRNMHELLLVGLRGNVPAPAPGDQATSILTVERTAHSAKPEVFLELIEEWYPNLPKIELYRRGAPRPAGMHSATKQWRHLIQTAPHDIPRHPACGA
jgi:N6-adenosine-specific RNA methylase IME4